MFAQTLLLPAFALFSAVAAQTSICKNATATITINSQAEATKISTCGTVAATVLVGNMTGTLALDGPTEISGSLIVDGAVLLQGLSSSTIGSINSWTMNELTVLTDLEFSNLTQVGTINFAGLKKLSKFIFTKVITQADSITITNSFLQSLDGISLKSVGTLDINNNNNLLTLSTSVVNVTDSLNIAANGNGNAVVVTLPNLKLAGEATFRNVSSISVPALARVNGSLILDGCGLTTFTAPKLTEVTGSIQFAGNSQLSNLTLNALSTVGGGFQIANNTVLTEITFPKLATVGGAIDLAGNFSTPSLPALQDVAGAMNIQSTASIDCSNFDKLKGNVVQGDETCVATTTNPESLNPSGTGTAGGSAASPTKSKGAAVSYGVNEAVAGLSVIGGIMQMLL